MSLPAQTKGHSSHCDCIREACIERAQAIRERAWRRKFWFPLMWGAIGSARVYHHLECHNRAGLWRLTVPAMALVDLVTIPIRFLGRWWW